MTTQIITPTSNTFNLQLQIPDNLIGKKVAVTYEVDDTVETQKAETKNTIKASEIFKDCLVSLKNFKFNRDEANDYE
jgi:hypothetical protein